MVIYHQIILYLIILYQIYIIPKNWNKQFSNKKSPSHKMKEASSLAPYQRQPQILSPMNSTTSSRKKNSNSLPSSNNPQLQKIITSRRKKNSKLSSEPPKEDILIPPYSFLGVFTLIYCITLLLYVY